MKLASSAFEHEGSIPAVYTCDKANVSPPLVFSDVPAGAQSLALIMDDPDAVKPAGKVWDHWVVFNMPPDTAELSEGSVPPGVQGKNSGGQSAYAGPCPPDAEHRYVFRLYALDTTLDLSEGVTKADVEQAMTGHIIEQAELVGRYERE